MSDESKKPRVVDGYAVTNEQRGEFSYTIIHLQLADGATEAFEFVPPYAYALSDEIVKVTARSANKNPTGA